MADESQVEAAIVQTLGNLIYPNGTSQPSALGALVDIQRGWPTESDIRNAANQNAVLVRVHSIAGLSRDRTRYPRVWQFAPQSGITLVATQNGQEITFSGTAVAGYFVGVISGAVGYSYAVQASDTPATVAQALAALIPNATASGPVLTLPNLPNSGNNVVTQGGIGALEVARQRQMFTVATWSPTWQLRDSLMQLAFPLLAYTFRLVLADNTVATLMDLETTGPEDNTALAGVWRRDLRLDYDYALTYTQSFPAVTVGIVDGPGPVPGYSV